MSQAALNIRGDLLPLARRRVRFVAALIDRMLLNLPLLPIVVALGEGRSLPFRSYVIFLSLYAVVYAVQMALLTVTGQTLGKRALNLRVVASMGPSDPGFARLVLVRHLLWDVFILAVLLLSPLSRWINDLIGAAIVLLDHAAIFGRDRRCLHDMIAETKVVQL